MSACATCGPAAGPRPTPPTSPTAPTTSSASTTSATTWPRSSTSASSASCYFAIVDEVDSILIDEARTPLIISGQGTDSTEKYQQYARIVPRLDKETDYTIDEKTRSAALTEEGIGKVEKWTGVRNIYDFDNAEEAHQVNQALKAHALFHRDEDYIVRDGEVVIVDEFTGRSMPGRRWSDGLHQAIEAKEGVKVQQENQTMATITFQNYFRLYRKLAGMTGTAVTEAEEFHKIYSLEVLVIPTNQPMVREDNPDVIYKTEEGKYRAVVEEIIERHQGGQPVLVGTTDIAKSERIARMLEKRGVPHNVLNAKFHEKEAEIVENAGQHGRRDDRHQHGRPRYRHQARARGWPTSAGSTSSAPSATSRAASTTSSAAAPAARATPAARASSSRSRTS